MVVRTAVAPWLFEQSVRGPIQIQAAEIDTGVAQIDSLRLDERDTARRAAHFYATIDARASAEASVLHHLRASLVVGDVPPLAFLAAYRAGVPSIALANFTWDWIYGDYPQFDALAPGVLDTIREAYATTTCALRLPFHGGFGPMSAVTEDIPLIARRSLHSRHDVRRMLSLDGTRPIVLASFGGYGLQLPYEAIARENDIVLLVTDHESAHVAHAEDPRLTRLTATSLAASGLRYEDLVAAADVVVSKPGYGIVSECLANDTALLFTSRGRFIEHDLFVAEMPRVLRCRYLAQEDLLAGRWSDALHALIEQPAPAERMPARGADVAADEILRRA